MKDLAIIFKAIEELGYDISNLSFPDALTLMSKIKNAIDDSGLKKGEGSNILNK